MQKKLQQMLSELTEISGIVYELYEDEDCCLASAFAQKPSIAVSEIMEQLKNGASKAERDGYLFLPVKSGKDTLLLVAETTAAEGEIISRLVVRQLEMFLESVHKSIDKNSFAAALLAEEIPAGDIYKRAAHFRLRDVSRTVYLFELAQAIEDEGAARMLGSLFAYGKQDMLFLKDETHLVLVKADENCSAREEQQTFALHTVDTMNAELMIKTRVAYSTAKGTLGELPDAYREASLALRIAGLFQVQKEVVAYSRLGIARLIYELPGDLCEMFLHEVFGENIPDQDIDEEMQVTIRKFFDNNLNISETARQLYLHRNTLVYRLERFEKLVGLDIRRFDDAMTYQIAMMVLAHYRDL